MITVGSSGSYVGAVLETLGVHYQSYLLDQLATPFATSVGGLVYVVAGFIAIGSYLLSGKAQSSIWLLAAPGIFLAVVLQRTEVSGSLWKFGNEVRSDVMVDSGLDPHLTEDARGGARVSSLFASYDRLVSSVVSQTVAVLLAGREKLDYSFIVRAEILSAMEAPFAGNDGFRSLVHTALGRDCMDFAMTAKKIADPEIPALERCEAAKHYKDLGSSRQVGLTDMAKEYVANEIYLFLPHLMTEEITPDPGCAVRSVMDLCGQAPSGLADTDATVGAQELYCDKEAEAKAEQQKLCDAVMRNQQIMNAVYNQPVVGASGTESALQRALNLSGAQYEQYRKEAWERVEKPYYCHEIWNLAYVSLMRESLIYLESVNQQAFNADLTNVITQAEQGADADLRLSLCAPEYQDNMPVAFSEALKIRGAQHPFDVVRQLAKKLFRNEKEYKPLAVIADEYAKRSDKFSRVGLPDENKLAHVERTRLKNNELRERTGLMHYAASMPYFQGLGLYWLSITYPLFAIMILVPGKQNGFFMWFKLWAWLKSWDIGVAVVMILDDVLVSLFGNMLMRDGNSLVHELPADIGSALASLETIDSTFNVGQYYSIVSAVLMMVPVVSAQIILGAAGGAGVLAQGMQRLTSQRGGDFGGIGGIRSMMEAPPQMKSVRALGQDVHALSAATSAKVGELGGTQASNMYGNVFGESYRTDRKFVDREDELSVYKGGFNAAAALKGLNNAAGGSADSWFGEKEFMGVNRGTDGSPLSSVLGGLSSASYKVGSMSRDQFNAFGRLDMDAANSQVPSTIGHSDIAGMGVNQALPLPQDYDPAGNTNARDAAAFNKEKTVDLQQATIDLVNRSMKAGFSASGDPVKKKP
ncbi:MAG: hypothetical protein PHC51_00595 [bacterium]|nr:hypothetical protein [bacterium]